MHAMSQVNRTLLQRKREKQPKVKFLVFLKKSVIFQIVGILEIQAQRSSQLGHTLDNASRVLYLSIIQNTPQEPT
jgi:hypothetical protein